MAKSFDPSTVWKPFGAFSQAVILGHGQTVHIKGQVALNASGELTDVGNMASQVAKVLENISNILAPMGGRMGDVISLQQFTTDIAAFMTCGHIRSRFFDPPFPVTTTVEVSSAL